MNASLSDLPGRLRAALDAHVGSIQLLRVMATRLETAAAVPREEAESTLSTVLARGRELRVLLDQAHQALSEAPTTAASSGPPDASSLEALQTLVSSVVSQVTDLLGSLPRERIERLVAELHRGAVVNCVQWRSRVLEEKKAVAFRELQATLEGPPAEQPDFPGPDNTLLPWLSWFWSLDPKSQGQTVDAVSPRWPGLVDFLGAVSRSNWVDLPIENDQPAPGSEQAAEPRGSNFDVEEVEPGQEVGPSASATTDNLPVDSSRPGPKARMGPPGLDALLQGMGVGGVVGIAGQISAGKPGQAKVQSADAVPVSPGLRDAVDDIPEAPTVDHEPDAAVDPGQLDRDGEQEDIRQSEFSEDEGDDSEDRAEPVTVDDIAAEAIEGDDDLAAQATANQELAEEDIGHDSKNLPLDPAPPQGLADQATAGAGDEDPAALLQPPQVLPQGSAPPPLPKLPSALSLKDFDARFWLGPDGQPVTAPWVEPDFGHRLLQEQAASIIGLDWPAAYVYAQAADALNLSAAVGPLLLDALRAFGQGLSLDALAGSDDAVFGLVRAVEDVRPIADSPADWVWLALLVLAQPQCPLDDETVGNLVVLAELSEPTAALLQEWLVVAQSGRVVEQLREQIQGAPPTIEDRQTALNQSRATLREALTRLYKAAGGSIQRTHCRDAWDKFMGDAHADLSHIADGRIESGAVAHLQWLRHRATRTFDRRGAKFQDRRQMDKGVDELIGFALHVIDVHREIEQMRASKGHSGFAPGFTERALSALDEDHRSSRSVSGWIAMLVWSHVNSDRDYAGDTHFDEDRLTEVPLLVEGWDDFAVESGGLDARHVVRPVLAAARLLEEAGSPSVEGHESWLATHRPDLLATSDLLQADSLRLILQHQARVEDEQHALAAHFRVLVVQLAELADDQFRIASAAIERIDSATENPLSAMDLAWLKVTGHTLTNRVTLTTRHLVARAVAEGRDEDEVRRIADSGRLGGLLRILGKRRASTSTRQLRATQMRRSAERLWPQPARKLTRVAGVDEAQAIDERSLPMVRAWLEHRRALKRRRLEVGEAAALREAFAEFIFQMTAKRRKNRVKSYTPQGVKTHYHQVELDDVRAWLVEDVGNPTFLPQLARYSSLSIKVAPVGTRDRTLPRRIHGEALAHEITIVLVPGLDPDQRNLVRDFLTTQAHTAPIAVLDDLDLCRILNPAGDAPDPLLATLEIMAEQQPWSRFCPYEVVEGQHVRLEMFVGRMKDAERLARQATYGRIFSGRRLGKTALLRFVGGHPPFKKLPSGNDLRIVFCAIAGEETEAAVSLSIIKSIQKDLRLAPLDEATVADPAEYLKDWLPRLLDDHPVGSWLILLDEADSFFGAQIKAPSGDSQRSLSWWMSRHSEKITDRNGIPRVRFVFCGYLLTDQNRGVWENKGDVLLLRPLEPQDAVQLAAGPLARIGIDAREQADSIAFQCGYQPAVLVRFGLTLVDHLERTRARQEREEVRVEQKDVVDVFLSNGVQKAIHEACWLNFVGHPIGQLVFAAFLMELRNRVPFAAVDDVPTRIFDRVREVTPDFDPSEIFADNWNDLVAQQLKELVDRSLLVQVGYRPSTYRLQFPHHLPVLLQQDPGQYVRDALLRIRTTGQELQTTWVVAQPIIEGIRFSLGPDGKGLGIRAVFVASQWQEPLRDAGNGLAPRVALGPDGAGPDLFVGRLADEKLDQLDQLDQVDQVDAPVLLVGGPSAARKAIAAEDDSGAVEVVRTARLSADQILGWLQRRRAAEFTGLDAPRRILQVTGGIPILVGAFDDALTQNFPTAPTLGEAEFSRLLDRFHDALPAIKSRLHDPSDPYGLSAREIELLRMICTASREYRDREMMVEALTDGVVELPDGVSIYRAEDGPAVRMLLALGLLPRAPFGGGSALEEVGLLLDGDPLASLFDHADA